MLGKLGPNRRPQLACVAGGVSPRSGGPDVEPTSLAPTGTSVRAAGLVRSSTFRTRH